MPFMRQLFSMIVKRVIGCKHAGVVLQNGRSFLNFWPFDIATEHDIRLRYFHGGCGVPMILDE
jgi:hypothetical protein